MSSLTTAQPAAGPIGRDLYQRIETLGLMLLRLDSSGRARILIHPGRTANAIVASTHFADAVRRHWDTLAGAPGAVIELWPGVMLATLGGSASRSAVHPPVPNQLHAVLMLGPEASGSEQFVAACGQAGLDTRAAAREIKPEQLLSPLEAHRLALTLSWMCEDGGSIDRRGGELQGLSLELADTYEELSLLYKLATSLRVNASPAAVLRDSCEELHQVIGFEWLAMSLAENVHLDEVSGQTMAVSVRDMDDAAIAAAAEALMLRFQDAESPVIVDQSRDLGVPEIESLGRNLLIVPMRVDGRMLGVLFGGDRLDGDLISSVDAKLCESLAGSLTIYLENHMLYEGAQEMFLGTLHALTSAIDAKDSYTHGHSERVALLARMLAEKVGIDDATCERVYLSGLVHDVGKIGVPESVLCKAGKLTGEEFGLIKLHPQIGANIIKDIRQMEDLVSGVLYHHEKFDGHGYPSGLSGHDIPLFGRLIGLADAFDAMSSDRTYRKALRLDQVLDEVRRCSGTQFDPELAAVFVEMDFTPFHDLIRKHERVKRPA